MVEGQGAHFEATIEPVDDPDMRIEWILNGQPIGESELCIFQSQNNQIHVFFDRSVVTKASERTLCNTTSLPGSRLKKISDFGWIIMDIGQVEQRDTGQWTLRIHNKAGEARCSCSVRVLDQSSISYDALHPDSWAKIQVSVVKSKCIGSRRLRSLEYFRDHKT